jgi:hypothetical protein
MTTKTLTGTYTFYYMTSPLTNLTVAASGYITTSGIHTANAGAYTVVNYGKVKGSVYLSHGGQVTNGSGGQTSASISGAGYGVFIRNAPGTVTNYGAIACSGLSTDAGVYLNDGGVVTNGAGFDTTASIRGGYGIWVRNAAGTVTNFGTVLADGHTGGDTSGVILLDGGMLTNGSASDTGALIAGADGVLTQSAAATVVNMGTIEGVLAVSDGVGVVLFGGGSVTNGSATDQTALIEGYETGVEIRNGPGTVVNFGAIAGQGVGNGDHSIYMYGGNITNGSGGDHKALITGYEGIEFGDTAGTLANFGTVVSTAAADYGLRLEEGGALFNGAVNDTAALIAGANGVAMRAGATGTNFGTIQGTGLSNGFGVFMDDTGTSLINGAQNDSKALLEGYVGAYLTDASTLTNFGTIAGAGGLAVELGSALATLQVAAGSAFEGSVTGYGGTLVLITGPGTISGLANSDVTVSGSMASTTFYEFGTVEIGFDAAFTLSGAATVAAGDTLDVAGVLNAAGTITSTGDVTTSGTLSGAGTLALTGGTATFGAGTDLTIAKVAESGVPTSAYFDATTLTVADVWDQTAGSVSAATGDRVNFTGTGDVFSGTLSGAGTIGFTGGTDTLSATALTATSEIIDGAKVTLTGTLDLTKTLSVTSNDLTIATAGASLTGGGIVSLSDSAANVIKGASASAVLTNVDDKIEGAGDLGDGEMGLTNDAGGTIDAYLGAALTLNLGTNTLANAGLIEAAGTGGLVISGATDNTGTLEAIKGTLTVDGAVSGAGTVKIAGGTADFASAFTENVAFTTAGGVLELADATTYTGTITGFAKTNITKLDLTDIAFTGATVSYSGTTTSGVLTVKSGAETAKIKLTGDYLSSTFTLGKDAGSGTIVTDPTAPAAKPPITTLPLITAMAGFGGASGASQALATATPHAPLIALAAPRTAIT